MSSEPNENERDSGSHAKRPNNPQEGPVESAQVAPAEPERTKREFEQWAYVRDLDLVRSASGPYASERTRGAWSAWLHCSAQWQERVKPQEKQGERCESNACPCCPGVDRPCAATQAEPVPGMVLADAQDAARYRWLRDNVQWQEGIRPVLLASNGIELDAGIDAAMSAEGAQR